MILCIELPSGPSSGQFSALIGFATTPCLHVYIASSCIPPFCGTYVLEHMQCRAISVSSSCKKRQDTAEGMRYIIFYVLNDAALMRSSLYGYVQEALYANIISIFLVKRDWIRAARYVFFNYTCLELTAAV
jgi:hypothetical protein